MLDSAHAPAEIELKLALPDTDPARIARTLTTMPLLAGVKPRLATLRNIYFDTPDQALRAERAALRLRGVREGRGREQWLQTYKSAGPSQGGLSQRGEWETRITRAVGDPLVPDAIALAGTPWARFDPRGLRLPELAPVFETHGTRTLWQVSVADSAIEIALDIGEVRAGEQIDPVRELELELLAGSPDALFDAAEQIAAQLAVLPAQLSKAERGWRLADGTLAKPQRAAPPALEADDSLPHAAQQVLGEMFGQFTANLVQTLSHDGPELVHQARVGWRRWRSGLWLFKPVLRDHPPPDREALRPLLDALGQARDLDVAVVDTLPNWAEPYVAGDAARAATWEQCMRALQAEREHRRKRLRATLADPAVGLALLRMARWLHALPEAIDADELNALGDWAPRRATRLQGQLEHAARDLRKKRRKLGAEATEEMAHDVRLLAKRTRYSVEALTSVLHERTARRWLREATEMQTRIGNTRDLMNLPALLSGLKVDADVVSFLRGVVAGQQAS